MHIYARPFKCTNIFMIESKKKSKIINEINKKKSHTQILIYLYIDDNKIYIHQ